MDRTAQTISLPDGRALGFAEYGPPDGFPVIGFFGAGARLMRPPDDQTSAAGVRLITAERPGFGLSSPQPGRRLLDWPADVAALADALGLGRFAIVGASQGGPYAMACAYALQERLSVVGLISSLAPFEAPGVLEGMARQLRLLPVIARRMPWLLLLSQKLAAPMARRNPARLIRAMFRGLPPNDAAVLASHPAVNPIFLHDAPEIYRQGGAGVAADIQLVTHPWGFRLEDIRAPVLLWQGEDDRNVPPAMGRYLARAIPGCQATFVPDAGHFMIYARWQELLGRLKEAAGA
ncbi:MAG TPA: alpha/beta hydrolase [Herpetosiphonaceae bacterium]